MATLIMAGQFFLSISILVVLHEMGHFIPARLFGTRVEKFYLFFDPWFSLFKKKIGDTEYGIGWLPLGGYVKISGMIDESFDKEQMEQPEQPWEFRAKPAWQRLIIMLGGVTVNFILGFFIFGIMLWQYGEEYLPAQNATAGIYVDTLGMELGLRDGDKILKVGDKPFEIFNDRKVVQEISIENARTITVERDGKETVVPIGSEWANKLIMHKNKDKSLFGPRLPFVVDQVIEGQPAEKAGFQKGDAMLSINGKPAKYFHEFAKEARKHKKEKIEVLALRASDTISLTVTTTKKGTIGLAPVGFETERKTYSLGQAMPLGVSRGLNFIGVQLKAFKQMFTGKIDAKESLGGFASIGKMFGAQWNWERFWRMTAILSLILGFMNLLPIPALDGGYVMFLLFEVVTGIKPSDKTLEVANTIGFLLILGLLIFANGLDIFRMFQ